MGRWRAASLIGVHLLILVHVGWWLWRGSALSPVEPSEGMEWSKHAVVNAGAIFFALAVLSTLIFGRFFCGWGCHVLALQDLCRRLLMQMGIRPRAFRSRLLLAVPAVAVGYMFILPLWRRALAGDWAVAREVVLTTDRFWATFPGFTISALTFFICGFLIVYFLGSKGFCTYGCPYGGIFAHADRFAPGRIRVTDACEGCGHCTATCTSNVDVKSEVRAYGMVVDPGCMKCLDCVTVCPKEALYFGFVPKTTPRVPLSPAKRKSVSWVSRLPWLQRWAILSVALYLGLALLFHESWSALGWFVAAGLAIGLGALVSQAPSELSIGQELLAGAAFLASLITFRGLYEIPFLMSLGLSAILAFAALTGWRLVSTANVRFQNHSLKRGGRLTRAGRTFVGGAALLSLFWIQSGWVRWNMYRLDAAFRPAARAWWGEEGPGGWAMIPSAAKQTQYEAAAQAGERVRTASLFRQSFSLYQLAFFEFALAHRGRARVLCLEALSLRPDFQDAELLLIATLLAPTPQTDTGVQATKAASAEETPPSAVFVPESVDIEEGLTHLTDFVRRWPERVDAALWLIDELIQHTYFESAASVCAIALTRFPENAALHQDTAILAMIAGRPEEAIKHLRIAVKLDPGRGRAHHFLGEALCAVGQPFEGIESLRTAQRLLPADEKVLVLLVHALRSAGREAEAEGVLTEFLAAYPNAPAARGLRHGAE